MSTDRDLYRRWVRYDKLTGFSVSVQETDLLIRAQSDLSAEAEDAVRECRSQIETYIAAHPAFATSLEPLPVTDPPSIIRQMALAGNAAHVGPMAAVAGAVAQFVGEKLSTHSPEVIVENGGDLYVRAEHELKVGLYAGTSPFSGKLALVVAPEQMPLGICTSSGTIGHSLSYGKADAVTVLARSAATADAFATAYANRIKTPDDVDDVLALGETAPDIQGLLIIIGAKLGTWGTITLAQ